MTCIGGFSCYNIDMSNEERQLKEILKKCNTYNCMDDNVIYDDKKDKENINHNSIIGVDNFTAKGIKVIGVDNFTAKGIKVI